MLWRHVTSWRLYRDVTWHHAVTSHDVMVWRHMPSFCNDRMYLSETSEITFFNLATLTFDLWPLNLAEIISRSFPLPNFVTLGQTVQPWERWLTDTQTHRHTGPILYPRPLTREGTITSHWPEKWLSNNVVWCYTKRSLKALVIVIPKEHKRRIGAYPSFFPSRVSGWGYKIGPVHLCVCVTLLVSAPMAEPFDIRT